MFNWYYVAAFPFAFFVSAFVGWLIELIVVRHLYGRVLETLLATWGVSLILVQAVRVRYGDNIGVSAPTWLRGGVEIIPYLTLEYARCFILVLSACCVVFLYLLMNFTRIGLKIRATVQGRETAETPRHQHAANRRLCFLVGGRSGRHRRLCSDDDCRRHPRYGAELYCRLVSGRGDGRRRKTGRFGARGLGLGTLNQLLEPRTFGEALLAAGLVGALVAWINLTVKAFRQGKAWGWLTLFVPIPLPLAVRFWRHEGIGRLFLLYCLAVAAIVVEKYCSAWFGGILAQDIQTRWARVFILMTVVIFIQWRPAGLFPPKGRLADV